jgi:hypothetical protein
VCLSMYLQLLQVRIDDFFPAVRALFAPAIATISSVLQRRTCLGCGSVIDPSTTYDRSRLRGFDWETVRFDCCAGSCCVGFAVLALDLWERGVSRGRDEGDGGEASYLGFLRDGHFED